jgi:hypothetical protein
MERKVTFPDRRSGLPDGSVFPADQQPPSQPERLGFSAMGAKKHKHGMASIIACDPVAKHGG